MARERLKEPHAFRAVIVPMELPSRPNREIVGRIEVCLGPWPGPGGGGVGFPGKVVEQ